MSRILHVQKITGIAGSEKHLLTLLPRLHSDRFECRFLILTEPGRPVEEFQNELVRNGIAVDRLTIHGDLDLPLIVRMIRYMLRLEFDVVHTHLIHADLYATLAAKIAGVPHIVSTKHGYTLPGRRATFYRLYHILTPLVDRVIVISDALKKHKHDLEGIPEEMMQTIYYALDNSSLRQESKKDVRNTLGIHPDALVLIYVGRLIPIKGHTYLFQALEGLRREVDGAFHVLIVGDGDLKETLQDEVLQRGLDDVVSFLGYRRDIQKLLQASDVFVFPTLGEGFGLVALEAMDAGLPVVASSVTSLPEIIVDGETGYLFPARDVQALKRCLVKLMGDPRLRMTLGEAGRQRARSRFSVGRMVEETKQVYEDLGL